MGGTDTLTTHSRTDEAINKSGYLYVYVSNETPNIDVFFDNLQVTHDRGPLLEETHFYPFGLLMNGISSKALAFGNPENKYKYNDGSELDETFGVNLYSTFFRQYDQQIGRFTGIDILAEAFSFINPYQFGYNNPVLYNDPLGALNTASFGSQYRMQKGPDGNYHTGWVTEMLWNDLGFFDSEGNFGGGGGGGGSYYNMMGLSSTQVLSQMNFGDSFGMNKKTGEYGFWRKYAYSIDNGSGNTSGEVVVGTRFISLPLSYHLENGVEPPIEIDCDVTVEMIENEIVSVTMGPLRVLRPIEEYVDRKGRTVTRTVTLYDRMTNYRILPPNEVAFWYSCHLAISNVYSTSKGKKNDFHTEFRSHREVRRF